MTDRRVCRLVFWQHYDMIILLALLPAEKQHFDKWAHAEPWTCPFKMLHVSSEFQQYTASCFLSISMHHYHLDLTRHARTTWALETYNWDLTCPLDKWSSKFFLTLNDCVFQTFSWTVVNVANYIYKLSFPMVLLSRICLAMQAFSLCNHFIYFHNLCVFLRTHII